MSRDAYGELSFEIMASQSFDVSNGRQADGIREIRLTKGIESTAKEFKLNLCLQDRRHLQDCTGL